MLPAQGNTGIHRRANSPHTINTVFTACKVHYAHTTAHSVDISSDSVVPTS